MHSTRATQYLQIHANRQRPASPSMLAGCLLLGATASHAHTFCVANEAALQTALTAASDGGV